MIKYWASPSRAATLAILQLCQSPIRLPRSTCHRLTVLLSRWSILFEYLGCPLANLCCLSGNLSNLSGCLNCILLGYMSHSLKKRFPFVDNHFSLEERISDLEHFCWNFEVKLVMLIFNRFFDNRLNRSSKNQFFLWFPKIWFRSIDHTEVEKSILNSFIRGVLKYSKVGPVGRGVLQCH